MRKEFVLYLLDKSTARFNAYRKNNPRAEINFRGANFHRRNLDGVNFRGLNLRGVRFTDCSLVGADFEGASLTNAQFYQVWLDRARFRDARMLRTSISNAAARNTNFRQAVMTSVRFSEIDFQNARFDKSVIVGSELIGCNFMSAWFRGAAIATSKLWRLELSYATSFPALEDYVAQLKKSMDPKRRR